MKKIWITLITVFFFTYLNAQVEIKPGLKGGLNFAGLTNLDNIDGSSSKGITSFHVGGTVSFKFAKFYTLQPEILYSKQGSEVFSNDADSKLKLALNYLSIVVNNKFFAGDSGVNFQVAPVFDVLLNSKNVDNPQGLDIAFKAAIGYDMANGLSFSLGYKQGLSDLFGRNVDTGNGAETTDVGDLVLNKVVQLSIGYQFDL